MEITYRETQEVRPEDVAKVFRSSGLKRPHQDIERIGRMIAQADVMITAWDGERMIGVARALTDYSYCCYLSDLAVDKEYQKTGIGTRLVEMLKERIGEECSLVLIAAPEAVEYYPKIGLTKSERAFTMPRAR